MVSESILRGAPIITTQAYSDSVLIISRTRCCALTYDFAFDLHHQRSLTMLRKFYSKFSDQSEEPYVRPSLQIVRTESIDSNATAPNNPGPGRNVGRLFDALGVRLEYLLNMGAERLGHGPSGVAQSIRNHDPCDVQPDDQDISESLQLSPTKSLDSIDSNATAPNLPGPGRNVGRLFDALGMRIEYALNRRAGQLRYGPDAIAQDIRNLRFGVRLGADLDSVDTAYLNSVVRAMPPSKDASQNLKKACRRLLKHCRCVQCHLHKNVTTTRH